MSDTNELMRVEMYSDGVFAIAATLLVLEIKVPELEGHATAGDLWKALWVLWPSYLAFVIGFTTILIMWVSHHVALRSLTKTSKQFLYANGLLLMVVTFIPFPTALLARYIDTDLAAVAVVCYSLVGMLLNFAFFLWNTAMQRPIYLLKPSVTKARLATLRKQTWGSLVVGVMTTTISWWFPTVGLGLIVATFVFWTIAVPVGDNA